MYFCSISKPPALEEACINSGELIVEQGGVLTLQERVKIATVSGLKLEAARYLETFDTQEDGAGLLIPAARRPGYDIVDAQNDLDMLRNKYQKAQQAAYDIRNKAAQDEAAKAFDAKVEAEISKRKEKSGDNKKPSE